MTPTQLELMQMVIDLETTGEVKSAFDLVALVGLEWYWGWCVLNSCEARGWLTVERRGQAPTPLKIKSTPAGRLAVERRLSRSRNGKKHTLDSPGHGIRGDG